MVPKTGTIPCPRYIRKESIIWRPLSSFIWVVYCWRNWVRRKGSSQKWSAGIKNWNERSQELEEACRWLLKERPPFFIRRPLLLLFQVSFEKSITHSGDQHSTLQIISCTMGAGRIYTEIGIFSCIGQGGEQLHGMRRMYIIIAHRMGQQEVILQVGCMGHIRTVFIPFLVVSQRSHIPLSIYIVIKTPVRDRRIGNTRLKDTGMRQQRIGSAEAD